MLKIFLSVDFWNICNEEMFLLHEHKLVIYSYPSTQYSRTEATVFHKCPIWNVVRTGNPGWRWKSGTQTSLVDSGKWSAPIHPNGLSCRDRAIEYSVVVSVCENRWGLLTPKHTQWWIFSVVKDLILTKKIPISGFFPFYSYRHGRYLFISVFLLY